MRRLVIVLITLSAGYWLFAETYRCHYGDHDSDPLRFSHFGSLEDYDFWKWAIDEFHHHCKAEQGARDDHCPAIQQEYVVGLGGHYNTKLRQQALAGTLPDVALLQLATFRELGHLFADISTLETIGKGADDASDFDAVGLGAFQINGVRRAVPVSGRNLLIYLNLNCLNAASRFHKATPIALPDDNWNMDDFQTLAELLTCDFDGDGKIDQFGFWLPQWIYYLPFIGSFGAEVIDAETGEWRFTDDAAQKALQFYQELGATRRVSPRESEVPQLFQDTAFLTGRVAICVNGPWFQPFLDNTDLKGKYAVLHVPQGPRARFTRVTWDGLPINAELTPKPRALAERFVYFLCSSRVQDEIGRRGKAIPARISPRDSFTRENKATREQFISALEYSRLQPDIPSFSRLDTLMNWELRRLVDPTSPAGVEQTLQRLSDGWSTLRESSIINKCPVTNDFSHF